MCGARTPAPFIHRRTSPAMPSRRNRRMRDNATIRTSARSGSVVFAPVPPGIWFGHPGIPGGRGPCRTRQTAAPVAEGAVVVLAVPAHKAHGHIPRGKSSRSNHPNHTAKNVQRPRTVAISCPAGGIHPESFHDAGLTRRHSRMVYGNAQGPLIRAPADFTARC